MALVLVGMLMLCHGFFGPTHQFAVEAGSASTEVSASLGFSTSNGDGPEREAEDANFAAVLLLALGWLLWLSLAPAPMRRVSPTVSGTHTPIMPLVPNHRMKYIVPLLQVFRL